MTSPNFSFLVVFSFPFSKNAIPTRAARGQVGVQSDPAGGLRPEAQGFCSALLARLVRPWEAESGRVYPGRALPEQMGACQCASQELG